MERVGLDPLRTASGAPPAFYSPLFVSEFGLTDDNDPPLTDRERQILILIRIAEGHGIPNT